MSQLKHNTPLKEVLPACFGSWEDWSKPPVATFERLFSEEFKCLRGHRWRYEDGKWKWYCESSDFSYPCKDCPFRVDV